MNSTYIGAEQAKILGYDKPMYKPYYIGDVVKLKSSMGKFKITSITGGGTLIYLQKKKILSKSYSNKVVGPYWMDEIVGCRNY